MPGDPAELESGVDRPSDGQLGVIQEEDQRDTTNVAVEERQERPRIPAMVLFHLNPSSWELQ